MFKKLIPVTIKRHKDKKGGHPHVIMGDIEDKHVSVGLTSKPTKGKNQPNYALEKDPLNTGRKSYMRRQGTVAPKEEYDRPRKGDMAPKDYDRATEYGEKAKQKYLTNKKR